MCSIRFLYSVCALCMCLCKCVPCGFCTLCVRYTCVCVNVFHSVFENLCVRYACVCVTVFHSVFVLYVCVMHVFV